MRNAFSGHEARTLVRLTGRAGGLSVGVALTAGVLLLAGAAEFAAAAPLGPPRSTPAPEFAKPKEDPTEVELDPAARALIDAEYLKPEERRELKLKHGVFEAADLIDTPTKARAAAMLGLWDDPSLSDPATPLDDRAEALVWRGEYSKALELIKDAATPRATALRLFIHQTTGKPDDAKQDMQALLTLLRSPDKKSAADLLWIVRGLSRASRLSAADNSDKQASGFKSLLSLLGTAREQLDKLDPFIPQAEAEILWDKDNPAEAGQAMEVALSLNASNAATWSLLGEIKSAQFDFGTAEDVVNRMTKNSAKLDGAEHMNVEAQLLLARLRLKQQDSEAAAVAVDKVLALMPNQPTALALRAAASAGMFDFAATDAALSKFTELYHGSGQAHFEVGKVLSDHRQYADAENYLRTATKIEPAWAEPAVELGLLLVQAGKDKDAREVLKIAHNLDPFNVRTENSLKLVEELGSYVTLPSEHFLIRYKPGIDQVMAQEMPPVLEKLYDRVTGNKVGGMDFKLPGKTTIELMPDHHWFSVRITGMPQVHTIAAATGPVIAMEAPREGAGHKVGPYDWPRVLQHEFTHTVGLARAKNRLPHWFTEASAVYLEDSPKDWSTCSLLAHVIKTDSLFDFDKINVAFVRPEKPTDRQQAYAQGEWMYEYMIEAFGPRVPLDLLDRYAKGQTEAKAIQDVLGVSREEFLTRFTAWAKTQIVQWGLAPHEGEPDLDELLAQTGAAEPTPEVVKAWLEKYPDHPGVLSLSVNLGVRDNNGKATPAMVPLLKRYAKACPVDPLPHRLLAQMYLAGELEGVASADAIEHLEWLDQREQYSTTYAVALARAYAEIGDWENAWKKAERATRIAPYDASARELAATIAVKLKDFKGAERHLGALILLEPDQPVHKRRMEALQKLKAAG